MKVKLGYMLAAAADILTTFTVLLDRAAVALVDPPPRPPAHPAAHANGGPVLAPYVEPSCPYCAPDEACSLHQPDLF